MKLIFKTFLLGFLISETTFGQDPQSICQKVDQELASRNLIAAKQLIEEAYRVAPNDYQVNCRYSRIMILYGDIQKESEKENHYLKALAYAEAAVKLNPQGSLGLVRRAAANGKVSLYKGVLSAASSVNATRDDVEKAIQLNNDGDQTLASAHYILGRAHLKLSEQPKIIRRPLNLEWGKSDDALIHLKKARELRTGYIMFHLDYARALIKKKQTDEAKKELDLISGLASTEFGDEERKNEAKALRADLD